MTMDKCRKKSKKHIVVKVIVTTCILMSILLMMPQKRVQANSNMSLTQLQNKFPSGKYWNHAGSGNNPDGYTSTPCTHHGNCSKNGTDYSGWCGCNSFGSSIQCFGFANKLAYDAYGSVYTSWGKSSLANLKPGDVIRYKNNGHSIFVTGVSGDTVTFGDCNSDGHCKIRWGATISKSTIQATLTAVYSAPSNLDIDSNPPSSAQISKSQNWYDLGDTIEISAYADNATDYYMSMFKDDQKIIGTGVDGGKFTMPANQYGEGNYAAYFSCSSAAGSVDTQWIEFSVVGAATYFDVWTSKPIYDLEDTVSISVSTVCAKGQVIGIDKDGVGRVVTEGCDSTYSIKASSLGVGSYSAYFSVYNGSGGVDTKRTTFVISDRQNLGEQFYAKIKNPSSGKYITNVSRNATGADETCGKSQIWQFTRSSDGWYRITSTLDNNAMDIENFGDAGSGSNLQVIPAWDCTAQRFYIYRAYNAYYLRPVCCDLFIDMAQNGTNNVSAWGGGVDWAPQKFDVIKIDASDIGDHKYETTVTKESTCTEEGVETHTCSVCGDSYTSKIEKIPHSYSTEWTTDILPTTTMEGSKSHHCTECGAKTDITVIPKLDIIPQGGVFSIVSGSGKVNDTAEVYIKLEKNPGIVGATLGVTYDTDKLQLISCEDQGVLNDYQWSELDHQPFLMNWEDPLATVNNTANGNIAKLQFKILKDLGDEGTELKLSIDTVYDVNIEDVVFTTENGKISMIKYKPGDINDDNTINSKDSILLRKYVLGGTGNINKEAADVNKDGAVNSKDSILLRKYVLGANVELK